MWRLQVLHTCFNLAGSRRQQVSKMEEVELLPGLLPGGQPSSSSAFSSPGSTAGGRSCFSWRKGLTEEEQEVSRGLEEELELLKLLDWPSAGDIKCGACGKVFDTKKLLYFHERNQHVDHGNCNICHKYFASKVKLNIHI